MPALEPKNEFVMVPVPVPLYASVIRMIADCQATAPSFAPTAEAPPAVGLPLDADATATHPATWSKADFAKIAPYLNPFSRVLIDLCAQTPGRRVRYRDAVDAATQLGIGRASARSSLAGLRQLVKRVFPSDFDERDLPVKYEPAPGKDRQSQFYMDEEAARLWTEVSREGERS